MSVSDTVTLSTLVILAWMFFKHLFLTELYSHVNTLKSFKSSSFLFGPQTKLSLTFTVSLLVSCLRGAASVLPYRHQFTAFASSPGGKCVRRSEKWGRGSMQMYADVCRFQNTAGLEWSWFTNICIEKSTNLKWNYNEYIYKLVFHFYISLYLFQYF